MKEPKWEVATEEEVWKCVAWHLAKNGIETILVGGRLQPFIQREFINQVSCSCC